MRNLNCILLSFFPSHICSKLKQGDKNKLNITVWNYNLIGSNIFMGQTRILPFLLEPNISLDKWVKLLEEGEIPPGEEGIVYITSFT